MGVVTNWQASAPRAPRSDLGLFDKQGLRSEIQSRRQSTPPDSAQRDALLAHALKASEGHAVVASYASLPGEPDTLRLITELHRRGVRVLLPALAAKRTPTWVSYDGVLEPGFMGIPEPPGTPLELDALAEASFIVTSALAVSTAGVRLGSGGGWWDRALLHAHPDAVIATLVNDAEILPDLPADDWDVPVGLIVTDRRIAPTTGKTSEHLTAGRMRRLPSSRGE